MSLAHARASRSAGFSLVEALVALAISTLLVAVLTRFVANTRLSALQVREQLAVDALSETLAEAFPANAWLPGRTDGRTGRINWRIEVAPINFSAQALKVKEKEKDEAQAGAAPTGGTGFSTDLKKGPDEQDAGNASQGPIVKWVPYLVTTVVVTPSGRRHEDHTLRLGPSESQRALQQSGQQAQQ